jgi:hypothetical protein
VRVGVKGVKSIEQERIDIVTVTTGKEVEKWLRLTEDHVTESLTQKCNEANRT